ERARLEAKPVLEHEGAQDRRRAGDRDRDRGRRYRARLDHGDRDFAHRDFCPIAPSPLHSLAHIAAQRRLWYGGVDPLPFAAMIPPPAPVAEVVDAPDSKSGGLTPVLVRVRPGAPVYWSRVPRASPAGIYCGRHFLAASRGAFAPQSKSPYSTGEHADRTSKMTTAAYIFLGLVGLIILVAVTWRVASRRRSIPCPVWLRGLVELDNPFAKTNRAAVIVQHLDLQPGMAVLDVGCGPGRLAIRTAEQVGRQGEVVAMDVQAGMLRRAEAKARAASLANIRFLEAAAGEGKLDRNHFDRALLVTVLGEIPDRE